MSSGGCPSPNATSVETLFEKLHSFFSGEKLSACDTVDGGEKLPSGHRSGGPEAALVLLLSFDTVLVEDFFWGSEESCRVDKHRGDARVLGMVLGVKN